ncbi:MAG: hypothetical protein JHC33_09885 [Ignisphaera sp.]|jgi:hypothetical protein|nr:hypothetical protein [Ignisphaera sp.]
MKDKSLEEIKLGEQAGVVLENPAFINAMQAVKDNIIKAMGTSGLGDEQTHNRLVIALQLLNQIEKQLTDVMQTGKMASIQTSSKLKIFR